MNWVRTAIMPQPMSTPTAAGMIARSVGMTEPTVAPRPRWASGISATCGWMNGILAVVSACCRVLSSSSEAQLKSRLLIFSMMKSFAEHTNAASVRDRRRIVKSVVGQAVFSCRRCSPRTRSGRFVHSRSGQLGSAKRAPRAGAAARVWVGARYEVTSQECAQNAAVATEFPTVIAGVTPMRRPRSTGRMPPRRRHMHSTRWHASSGGCGRYRVRQRVPGATRGTRRSAAEQVPDADRRSAHGSTGTRCSPRSVGNAIPDGVRRNGTDAPARSSAACPPG